MYLVQLPPGHSARWLFLHCDPQVDGCPYEAVPDVELEDVGLALGGFDGDDFEDPVLGRSWRDRSLFKRFTSYNRLLREGFEYLPGPALELSSWRAFVTSPPVSPDNYARPLPRLSITGDGREFFAGRTFLFDSQR